MYIANQLLCAAAVEAEMISEEEEREPLTAKEKHKMQMHLKNSLKIRVNKLKTVRCAATSETRCLGGCCCVR